MSLAGGDESGGGEDEVKFESAARVRKKRKYEKIVFHFAPYDLLAPTTFVGKRRDEILFYMRQRRREIM